MGYWKQLSPCKKCLVGEEKILLADKIIYLAVEFALLRDADFYTLADAAEEVSSRRQALYEYILIGHTDGFPLLEKHRVCTPQKTFRLTQKLHLR